MISGLYAGASNSMGQGEYQAVIARNLANINTVGYKKNVAVFDSYVAGGRGEDASGTSTLGKVATDFTQGALEYTGNELDISIKGEGLFEVKTNNGNLFTRKGQFTLSRDRKIMTPEGWALMGDGAEIQLPKDARNIVIKTDGTITADNKDINKIKVVKVEDPETLVSVGASAYKIAEDAPQPQAADAADFEIAHRYLEKSNVNAIDEMVNMIANMRSHQYGHKTSNSISDSVKKLIQLAS